MHRTRPLLAIAFSLLLAACGGADADDATAQDGNAAVLAQLEDAGSDLSKPHPLEFTLYFPTRDAAMAALPELQAQGYSSGLYDKEEGQFRVVAVREAVPTPDAIDGFEAQVQAIAAAHGGEYDGWGSAIVP
jgi:hypothetical protein